MQYDFEQFTYRQWEDLLTLIKKEQRQRAELFYKPAPIHEFLIVLCEVNLALYPNRILKLCHTGK